MAYQKPYYDRYWRLDDHAKQSATSYIKMLRSNGYVVKKHSDLTNLASRIDLGLICYDKCHADELRKFANHRGIAIPSKKCSKGSLVELLLTADKSPTFEKFLDLPAELRLRIYDYYISDFQCQSLVMPTQPPLTRIHRIFRMEALPLFYKTCKFEFEFEAENLGIVCEHSFHSYLHHLPHKHLLHLRQSARTFVFLNTLSSQCIADIRRFEVIIARWSGIHTNFDVDFSPVSIEHQIAVQPIVQPFERTSGRRAAVQKARQKIEEISKRCESNEKLKKEDIESIVKAFEEGYYEGQKA